MYFTGVMSVASLNLISTCMFISSVTWKACMQPNHYLARACASKGLCDRSWCLLYIYLQKKFEFFFYLSKYSLSDTHFNTGRLLFEFNRLQYTLAAPEVFVSSTNPVSLPSGYRVSIVRNTNIDQIETTPHIRLNTPTILQVAVLDCPQEALGKWIYMPSWPGA